MGISVENGLNHQCHFFAALGLLLGGSFKFILFGLLQLKKSYPQDLSITGIQALNLRPVQIRQAIFDDYLTLPQKKSILSTMALCDCIYLRLCPLAFTQDKI